MLTISAEPMLWAGAALVYIVIAGGVLLKRSAQQQDARITKPFITMLQVAGISSIVFAMASVPSTVARIVNPEILPFIMPYTPILFAVCFVVFINKLESKRSGWHQAAVSLWLAALICAAFIVAQLVVRGVFTG
ncbi:MAG TPA: hypothetical protein VJY83_04250 [Thiopseudomonas sp.]|nr:hypothetical protein [Thiopseudomonas sp.]